MQAVVPKSRGSTSFSVTEQCCLTFPKSLTSKRSKASNSSLFFMPKISLHAARKVLMFFRHRNCVGKTERGSSVSESPGNVHTCMTCRKDLLLSFILIFKELCMDFLMSLNGIRCCFSFLPASFHSGCLIRACS